MPPVLPASQDGQEAESPAPTEVTASPVLNTKKRWSLYIPYLIFISVMTARIFDALVPQSSTFLPYDERQLLEVAMLMDQLYTTLADMTFIPHASIQRGPHQIDTTDHPCNLDPAVLRLMEILPYVDTSLVKEADWLFGGEFADYRTWDHLIESCDPLHAEEYWDYMTEHTIALTIWGSGGWNGDATWVLLYDTQIHAIRVYDGEDWIAQGFAIDTEGNDRSGVGIFDAGIEARESGWDGVSPDGAEWLDAPTLLQRLNTAYLNAAWTPWETSNREQGWGVAPDTILDFLIHNGWRDEFDFDLDQFNIDFIRARNKPSGRGYAERAMKKIDRLQGGTIEYGEVDDGDLERWKRMVAAQEKKAQEAKGRVQQWHATWRLLKDTFTLGQLEAELARAEEEKDRHCPNEVCVQPEDLILWEVRKLETEVTKARVCSSPTKKCERRMANLPRGTPSEPGRFATCVRLLGCEQQWLYRAYCQAKSEALEHCAKTGCTLLPPYTLEQRSREHIIELEHTIARANQWEEKMVEWMKDLPERESMDARDFLIDFDLTAQGRSYRGDDIEIIEGLLADERQHEQLWNWLDNMELD